MPAIVTIRLECPLSWPDLRDRLRYSGEPEYAFMDAGMLEELARKSYPTAALRDGTQVVGIRVGRTLVLPIWDEHANLAEIELEDGRTTDQNA